MTLSRILVHVDATPHSDARVELAASLAKRFAARLTGIYVIEPDPVEVVLPLDVDYGGAADRARTRSEARQSHCETHFSGCLRRADLPGDWNAAQAEAAFVVPHWARRADLTVAGQSDPDDALDTASDVATHTLLESGRPVLVVPYAGRFDTVGTNVVVAWKETREAARAVHDAMPLLQAAESVTLLAVNAPEDTSGAEQTVLDHLETHGVKARFARLDGSELSAGELILNRCYDLGADLLVAGGYGHSRVRERILGGVTRTLFEQMTLPVLMSH